MTDTRIALTLMFASDDKPAIVATRVGEVVAAEVAAPLVSMAWSAFNLAEDDTDEEPDWESVAKEREAELAEMRGNYEGACKTVAAMHKAAVGEVRGPNRGIVEDVEDVRLRAEAAEAAIERVRAIKKSPSRSPYNTYTNAQDDGWDQALDDVLAALDGTEQKAEASICGGLAEYQAAVARVAKVLVEAERHRNQTDPSERQDCVMCGADHFVEALRAIDDTEAEEDEAPPPGTAPNEQYRFATTWAEYDAGRRAALDEPTQDQS